MFSKSVNGKKDDEAEKYNDEPCTFSNWREFNIHDDDDDCYGDDDDESDNEDNGNVINENGEGVGVEEDTVYLFRLFDTENDDDIFEDIIYEYPMPTQMPMQMLTSMTMTEDDNDNDSEKVDATMCTKIVTIRHHSAYPNSTGLAVWRSAEILARYLCECEQQLLLQQKVGIITDSSGNKTTDSSVQVQNKKVLELGAGAGKFFN
jgi:hypothetical protein